MVLTTEEWNVCESDNPALSYSPSDYTHNLQVTFGEGGREGERKGVRSFTNACLPPHTPELQQRDSEEEHVRKKMLLKEKVKEAFLGGRR